MACTEEAGETLARRTRRLLAELDRHPRKSRGQNFLIDASVAERIAGFVCEGGAPRVLEIGAGLGALTEVLARSCEQVVALEIESAYAGALERLFADRPQVRVVVADALAVDLAACCDHDCPAWRVVGNLPYSTGTAILLRLLAIRPGFGRIVVTVQREVGDRLTAGPGSGSYGSLSVAAEYHLGQRRTVARVARGAFYPQPKVDSSVVLLEPRAAPLLDPELERLLFAAVRGGFGQRRKRLANALAGARALGLPDRATVEGCLAAAGVGANARAEELSLEAFTRLTSALWESGVEASGPE